MPDLDAIRATESFVSREFEKHPHYSFNDWTVMRDHSFKVRDIALQIGEGLSVDSTVVSLGALLHDIGKTYEASAETLHERHEDFNLTVSKSFLDTLALTEEQLQKLEEMLQHKSDSEEMRVVEDADALALYADKRLYTLFIQWARENHLDAAIHRKLQKFNTLHFKRSREIGLVWYQQMKKDWGF
ncbi:MAG: HD domain-containing protein [Minisyncoccota bacterium]